MHKLNIFQSNKYSIDYLNCVQKKIKKQKAKLISQLVLEIRSVCNEANFESYSNSLQSCGITDLQRLVYTAILTSKLECNVCTYYLTLIRINSITLSLSLYCKDNQVDC